MRTSLAALIATGLLGGTVAPAATAATVTKVINVHTAGACALSIPTTNTTVRAKATGFRNEGGVNNFVICGLDIDDIVPSPGFESLTIGFASIDGAAHSIDCTAMSGFAYNTSGDYSTKSVDVPAGGKNFIEFLPADFPTTELEGWNTSVTCLLPKGLSILILQATHEDEIGD